MSDLSSQTQDWLPQHERLFSFWNVGIALAGIALFLAGTIVQLIIPRVPEAASLVSNCLASNGTADAILTACRRAVVGFDRAAHRGETIWPLTLAELLRSFGIAAVLSIIISVTIERSNRSRFMSALANKTRELSSSVFAGMFNRDHPPALLTAVKRQILERDLIRDSLSVTYTLSIWEPGPDQRKLGSRRFVRVDVIVATTTRNVSTLRGEDAGAARVPLVVELSRPMEARLNRMVKVTNFVVHGRPISDVELADKNEKLQLDLARQSDNDVAVEFGSHPLQAGESVSISASYTMMKEIEDTEIFLSLQISKGLALTVNDNTNGALRVHAKDIHSSRLQKVASGANTTQWLLNDIVLPLQGIIVWWKVQDS